MNLVGGLNADDIDAISSEVLADSNAPRFNLNGDKLINDEDRQV